jgi:hypothetical protein
MDIELVEFGLVLYGWCVHRKAGEVWVNPPGRKRPDVQGNDQWAALAVFTDTGKRAAFQREAVAAFHRLLEPSTTPAPSTASDLVDEMPF